MQHMLQTKASIISTDSSSKSIWKTTHCRRNDKWVTNRKILVANKIKLCLASLIIIKLQIKKKLSINMFDFFCLWYGQKFKWLIISDVRKAVQKQEFSNNWNVQWHGYGDTAIWYLRHIRNVLLDMETDLIKACRTIMKISMEM